MFHQSMQTAIHYIICIDIYAEYSRQWEAATHLDGADVLLAEPLQRLDDLLVRAPQLQHNTALAHHSFIPAKIIANGRNYS